MNYESRLEQDRRVIRAMNIQYRQSKAIEHDMEAMAALLLGEGVEHVTCWTVDGRHQHRSVQS